MMHTIVVAMGWSSVEGRLLAERAFYEDGLTANYTQIGADLLPQYGEYLLYSERERDRKATKNESNVNNIMAYLRQQG